MEHHADCREGVVEKGEADGGKEKGRVRLFGTVRQRQS